MSKLNSCNDLRKSIVGINTKVPVLDGGEQTFVNFDNAASTPTFIQVTEKINEFLKWYSNVHRGTGFKSQLSSYVFDTIREKMIEYAGGDLEKDTLVFGKNTTEMVNILANRMELKKDDIVLTSIMEHHSNDLPWRSVATVEHVMTNEEGDVDFNHFQSLLKKHGKKVKVVTMSGASNVTGEITDIYKFAEEAHKHGALFSMDAAQLAPHRPLDMRPYDDPGHIDFVTFAAHKMYAPFGIGVLVGDFSKLTRKEPYLKGGGTVKIVTPDDVLWDDAPHLDEAGTPVIVGVVAMIEAVKLILEVGWDEVIKHEAELTSYALKRLREIPGVEIYGDTDPGNTVNRLGVIPFNLKDMHHALVAAILSYESAIGVRNGCFCAHPFILNLLQVKPDHAAEVREDIAGGDKSKIPGIVRMSFGCYNNEAEVDRMVESLKMISDNKFRGKYHVEKASGEYHPEGYKFDFDSYFKL